MPDIDFDQKIILPIVEFPEVPTQIIEAYNQKKLVIFIGAGVSRLVGCKGWDQLAQELIEACYLEQKAPGKSLINYSTKIKLGNISDHRKIITICKKLLENEKKNNVFYDVLEKALDVKNDDKKDSNSIYSDLASLQVKYITTNADNKLSKLMSPANVYNSKTELGDSALKNCEMMHIHGTIKNRDSLVFDLPSYFKNYNDTQLKSFLASVFSDNTILFIGYGLAEFEILEFLFNQKQGESTQSKFLLNGYYSSDSDYYELEQSYYESMRITVIPFCFDERGYDQLGEVVKRWVSILHRVTTSLAVSVREIDEAISEPEPDFLKIFLMLEYKATARKYLFAKLFNAPYPFVWFDELETREYFDPNGMPEPTKNDEGETIIEEWEVIGYLINCTQKNIEIKDESSWERIVKVIDEAINHITTTHLDNYKTDSGMVELIFYLPFSKIKSDWIAYIEYSLNTKSDNTLLSNKLTHGLEKVLLSQHENAKAFLLKVIKLLLQPSQKMDEDSYSNHNSRMDSYALEQFFQKHAEQLSEIFAEDGVEICETIIDEILNFDAASFSVYLIPQITLTYSDDNYFELEQLLVSFWTRCLLKSPVNIVTNKFKLYLERDHQIFQRVAVFIIGKRFDELGDLFFAFEQNPLDNYFIKYEIFALLKQNSSLLKESDIQRMVEWIENQKFEYLKGNELDDEELSLYKINIKKEWLFALLETNDNKIVEIYSNYFKLSPAPLAHPGYTFWMDKDQAVITAIENLNFTLLKISGIIDKSNSFFVSGENQGQRDKIDFSNSIREDVSANPDKYLTDVMDLLELNPTFQYSLLMGLFGVAQNRDDFPWEEVLLYIDALLKRLDEQAVSENDTRNLESVLSASLNIMELLLNSRNISAENVQTVDKILTYFLQSERHFSSPKINDRIISTYNSIDFKLYSLWFLWFFRVHHLDLLSDDQKEEVKLEISQYFENCRNLNAFHFSFGRFLPNFFSKEPAFVENLISKIDGCSDDRWIDFMEGYLFFGSNLYSGTYELLKRNGLYLKALNHSFEDDTVENRKIAHISLVFLEGEEPLSCDDSLMKSILDSNNSRYFGEVIKFIGRKQNLRLVEEHFDNFRELFLTITQKVETCQDVELKKKHLGLLGGWIILFHDLDNETFEYFKTIAQYLHLQHKTTTFLNHLITFASTHPNETSQLLKIALKSDPRNTFYDIEKMLDLIDALKVSLESDILIPICNIFITKGYTQFSEKVQELNERRN